MAEDGLPASFIKRLVKAKLAELGGSDKGEVALQKEAVAAFGEAAKIFIHYLTFTANEFCHEAKRSTINAEDVLKAVEEIEFSEFLAPLRDSLAGASRAVLLPLPAGTAWACRGRHRCAFLTRTPCAGYKAAAAEKKLAAKRKAGEDGDGDGGDGAEEEPGEEDPPDEVGVTVQD